MSNSELSMYAHASEPIVIVGRDGEIVFANEHAEEHLDYRPGTLAGLSIEDVEISRPNLESLFRQYYRVGDT